MTDNTYTIGYREMLLGDWATDDIRVLLLSGALDFDPTHRSVHEVLSANTEMSGTGYARKTAPTRTKVGDRLDHGDIAYTTINAGTIAAAVYFRQVTRDEDSPVIFFKDDGDFPLATTGVTVTMATGASGLADVTLGRRQGILLVNENTDRNGIRHADRNRWSDIHQSLTLS